jgi:hypothetical protein
LTSAGDLAVNQLAHEDVRTVTDGLARPENVAAFRMTPPAPPDPAAGDGLGKTWKNAPGSLENHSVTFDERDCFLRCHDKTSTRFTLYRYPGHVQGVNFALSAWSGGDSRYGSR